MKAFNGKWRIIEMEVWGQDYVDMEVPRFICIYLHLADDSAFRAIKST